METRVFEFVIGNLRPSQLNSVMEAACCDLVSDNTAWKFFKMHLLEYRIGRKRCLMCLHKLESHFHRKRKLESYLHCKRKMKSNFHCKKKMGSNLWCYLQIATCSRSQSNGGTIMKSAGRMNAVPSIAFFFSVLQLYFLVYNCTTDVNDMGSTTFKEKKKR